MEKYRIKCPRFNVDQQIPVLRSLELAYIFLWGSNPERQTASTKNIKISNIKQISSLDF